MWRTTLMLYLSLLCLFHNLSPITILSFVMFESVSAISVFVRTISSHPRIVCTAINWLRVLPITIAFVIQFGDSSKQAQNSYRSIGRFGNGWQSKMCWIFCLILSNVSKPFFYFLLLFQSSSLRLAKNLQFSADLFIAQLVNCWRLISAVSFVRLLFWVWKALFYTCVIIEESRIKKLAREANWFYSLQWFIRGVNFISVGEFLCSLWRWS